MPGWVDIGEDVEVARVGDTVIVRRISFPDRRIRVMSVEQWRAACPPEFLFITDDVEAKQ